MEMDFPPAVAVLIAARRNPTSMNFVRDSDIDHFHFRKRKLLTWGKV